MNGSTKKQGEDLLPAAKGRARTFGGVLGMSSLFGFFAPVESSVNSSPVLSQCQKSALGLCSGCSRDSLDKICSSSSATSSSSLDFFLGQHFPKPNLNILRLCPMQPPGPAEG